jgi:retinol dehydrogenase-12
MLLSKGAKVYIASVEAESYEGINELRRYRGRNSVFLLPLDLANLDSIKDAANEFLKNESKLHTLYNNE